MLLIIRGVGGKDIFGYDSWQISGLTGPETIRGDNNSDLVLMNRNICHNT